MAVQFRNLTDLHTGVVEEREWSFDLFGIDFESGDNIEIEATRTMEFLDYGYEVSDGIDILLGEYTTWELGRAGTHRRPPPGVGRRRIQPRRLLGRRPDSGERAHLLQAEPGREHLDQLRAQRRDSPPGGLRPPTCTRSRGSGTPISGSASPTRSATTTTATSWGSSRGCAGSSRPGNDVFLVYTHNWRNLGEDILNDRDLITLSRGGAVKASYTYRF